jgi:glycosyltransferase involved in cell wall biosynthesis
MLDYATFHLRAMLKALALPRFDIVVTLTTPPLIALIGQMLRMTRGTRHVYWSMDLHPDASLALRLMRKSRLGVRLLSWLSDLLYRRADRVVALGPYMEDRLLAKGVRSNRMSVVPVWGRRDDSDAPPSDQHPIRQQLGLTEKFVIMYSGNHGFAHRFDEIVEAARRLRHRDDIAFLFVGDGPRLHEVIEARNLYGLQNIFHLDFFPRSQLGLSLSTGDVHLVTLRQEMAGICVPSKVYGAMAAGRPVLFIGPEHCEVADTIRDANCGATVRPGDVEALVDTIELLAKNPAQVRAMGERGVAAFVAEYERDACCARWCWLIGELTGAKAAPLVDSAEPAPFALNHASPV